MSRYIKLQDAKNAIDNCITEQTVSMYATSAECRAARHGANLALFALDDIPTADVVEVVRCKDCIYYKANSCFNRQWDFESSTEIPMVRENDFCSYGERRDDGETI